MNEVFIALISVFLISLVSNILPFAGAPYTLVTTYFLLRIGINPIHVLIFIIISGIGAGIAKTFTYLLGIGVRKPLSKNKNLPLLKKFMNSKYFPIILFILAILPGLPLDDYLYIGGGVIKFSLLHMLKITVPAKIFKSGIEIPLELLGVINISSFLGISPTLLTIIFTIVFLILGIVLIKIDWEKIYLTVKQKYLNHYL